MTGTAYGVILNDREERAALADAFAAAPYGAPPQAPVLFIKPRGCLTTDGAPVVVPADLDRVEVAATIALRFAPEGVAAAALALEVSAPHRDYFRPAIRERCRDTFLPLARFAALPPDLDELELVTEIGGAEAHRWSLRRLVRPAAELVAEVSSFMTFEPGDILMVGLAGDAPTACAGQEVAVVARGLPTLAVRLVDEAAFA